MGWVADNAWVVWLVIALALGGLETASLALVLLMLAAGAAGGAVVAALGAPAALQLLTAAVVAAFGLAVVRPVAVRHVRQGRLHPSGVAALVGREALTVTAVDAAGGRVRLGGEVWSARAYDQTPIAAGQIVDVVQIEGATAVVLGRDPLFTGL